jgi:hypothetical protein
MGVTVVTKIFDTSPSNTKFGIVSWYVGKMQCQFNRN